MRYYNNRDAARHVATNAPAPTVDGQRAGKGGAWRRSGWRRGMGDGRGNLRENREDPAPTVGRSEDAIAIQMSSHRRRHAHTVHPACHPPMGTYNLYHDAARRIATNASPPPICACAPLRHRMRLPRESPTSMSDPTVFVATRRAAARRVVILLHGSHLWGPYGFSNDAARRVATFFENLNCGIEISLPARRSPKND